MASEPKQETAVEGIKVASDFLRGDLADQLASDAPNVSEDSEQPLKFHGITRRTTATRAMGARWPASRSSTSS